MNDWNYNNNRNKALDSRGVEFYLSTFLALNKSLNLHYITNWLLSRIFANKLVNFFAKIWA